MYYPVDVKQDGEAWMVSFPDIPEALTGGATQEASLSMARDALITSFEFYYENQREVPAPSKASPEQLEVSLPASVSAKVLLLNEMVRQNIKPSQLARKIGTSAQEFNRITNLRHATKVDVIQLALAALGKRLELTTA